MNAPSILLRIAVLCGLTLVLCQCTSLQIEQVWCRYDPLNPPSPQMLENLNKEASQIETKLERHPDNSRHLARLADIRFLQGKEAESVALYERALEVASGDLTVDNQARFGTALLHVERNSEACAVLERILQEDPNCARALLSYAEYQADIIGNSAYARYLLQRAKETQSIYIPPDFEQALEQNLN